MPSNRLGNRVQESGSQGRRGDPKWAGSGPEEKAVSRLPTSVLPPGDTGRRLPTSGLRASHGQTGSMPVGELQAFPSPGARNLLGVLHCNPVSGRRGLTLVSSGGCWPPQPHAPPPSHPGWPLFPGSCPRSSHLGALAGSYRPGHLPRPLPLASILTVPRKTFLPPDGLRAPQPYSMVINHQHAERGERPPPARPCGRAPGPVSLTGRARWRRRPVPTWAMPLGCSAFRQRPGQPAQSPSARPAPRAAGGPGARLLFTCIDLRATQLHSAKLSPAKAVTIS